MSLCGFRIKHYATNSYFHPFELLGWVTIICFSGFRYGIGTDYYSYESIFYSIERGGAYNESLELGFKLLGALFPNSQDGFFCFLFVLSLITNIVFLIALYRENKKLSENIKLLGLLLFFLSSTYFWPFNGVRQGIACAFVAYSLKYIYARSFIKFAICILIASLFHKSALLVVVIYFLYPIRIPHLFYLFAVLTSIIIHQVGVVSFIGEILLPYLGDKYARYIYNPLDFGGSGLGVYVYVLIFLVLWSARGILSKNLHKHYDILRRIDFYLLLYTIGIILRIFALDNLIFVRFAYYFTIFDMFFIPYLISQFKRPSNRIVLSIFFLFVYFILFLNSIMNSNDLLPYESILLR
nr:EpsG family protein [Citrobacter sp. NCU1]